MTCLRPRVSLRIVNAGASLLPYSARLRARLKLTRRSAEKKLWEQAS
jgi:hypothetical protein